MFTTAPEALQCDHLVHRPTNVYTLNSLLLISVYQELRKNLVQARTEEGSSGIRTTGCEPEVTAPVYRNQPSSFDFLTLSLLTSTRSKS